MMAQGNFTWQRGDITGDIYFDYLDNVRLAQVY